MNILRDMTLDRDKQELSLGDTLDVKAGILLALIAVLATISGTLLADSHLDKRYAVAQMVSLCVVVVGAVCAVWTLIPRNYYLPGAPAEYKGYIENMELAFPGDPEEAERRTAAGIAQMADQRIEKNHKINALKSRWLTYAFFPALVALMIDLGTLVCVAVSKTLS